MLTDWERLVAGYKQHRLQYCLGEFKDLETFLKQACDEFRAKEKYQKWGAEYDLAHKEADGGDGLQAQVESMLVDTLRERKRQL